MEQLEREIDQVTPAKRKLFNKLFQNHEQQLLQDLGTKATGPRSIFAKELALRKAAIKDEAQRAANMTTGKHPQFQIRLSDAETEATTWSFTDTEHVTNQLESEIYGISSNEQMRFKKECCLHLIKFEAWWETFVIQVL